MTSPPAPSCAELTCGHLVPDLRATYGMVFQCPDCGKRSANLFDIRAGYCGRCRAFVTDPHPPGGRGRPATWPE